MSVFDDLIVYSVLTFGLYTLFFYVNTYIENKKKMKSPKAKNFPKVSILIPAYNKGDYIERTVRSVLNLDYPKKEIIVVDDGSTDDTYQKLLKFKKRGVKVLRKENEGYKAAAVNLGIKECTGKFIFILDADSFPEKGALKKMVGHFQNPNVMAVVPSMKPWKPKNLLEKLQVIEYLISSLTKKIVSLTQALTMTPGAPIIRKSFIDKFGGFDVKNITEDLEYGLRIQSKNYQIAHAFDTIVYTVVPKTLKSLYRQRLRWSFGSLKNMKKYSFLLSLKYGDLGFFIIPSTLVVVSFIPIITFYYFIKMIFELLKQFHFASLINFNIMELNFSIDIYDILMTFTDLKTLLIIISVLFSLVAYQMARKQLKEKLNLIYIFYVFIYGWLLNLVGISSFWYFIRDKEPNW